MVPNFLDFIILIFLIACFFLSSLRGGSKQVFSFVVIIISFVIAGRYYGSIAGVLPEKVFPESFAGASGFGVVFLLAFSVISFVGRFTDFIFKQIHFGGIDRYVSILLGILKGFTLGCMTVVIILINYPSDSPLLTGSITCPYILYAAGKVANLLPQKDKKEFYSKAIELREFWQQQEGNNKEEDD